VEEIRLAMSASSYAGNALACRAGLSTIQYIQRGSLLEDCTEKGKLLLRSFRQYVEEYPGILRFADGLGLLIGIHTQSAKVAFELAREMTREGVLVIPAFGNTSVLVVEPPLVISFQQIRTVADAFANACAKVSPALIGSPPAPHRANPGVAMTNDPSQ
jgi:acetylornithine/succinyldiaminopimelate/putrescine aminotransferase